MCFMCLDAWNQGAVLTSVSARQIIWETKRGGTDNSTDIGDVALDDIFLKKACPGGQ